MELIKLRPACPAHNGPPAAPRGAWPRILFEPPRQNTEKKHRILAVFFIDSGGVCGAGWKTAAAGRAGGDQDAGMKIDIGIPESSRREIAGGLSRLLADSYTLYLKTQNYHWNVTGPMFQTLHLMFEEQYTELAAAVDELAERIRSLGVYAPGSYSQFRSLTSIKEASGPPKAKDMALDLAVSHETAAKTARGVFPAAEKGHDEATMDLLTQRIRVHEKTAWMLRSLLEPE